MCSKALSCPLCCQPSFSTVDSLRISLVSVTNRPLVCPICHETQIGLDKLTIHLFSHTLPCEPFQDIVVSKANQIPIESTVAVQDRSAIKNPEQIIIHPSKSDKKPTVRHKKSLDKTDVHQFQISYDLLGKESRDMHSEQSINIDNTSPIKIEASEIVPMAYAFEPQCNLCGSTFRNQELHLMHMELVHHIRITSEENLLGQRDCTIGSISPKENGLMNDAAFIGHAAKSRFQCHLCSKHFKMKGSLRVHLRVVHTIGDAVAATTNLLTSIEHNTKIFESTTDSTNKDGTSNYAENIKNVREIDVVEDVVNATSSTSSTLLSNGSETKPWECDHCAKSFTTKYFLKKHKRLHTGEMPYTCDICNKTFTFQQSYHKHLLYHNDDKPHVCSICNRAFKELSTLHNHERIHSGEKPFKCETCDKCFRQRVSYLVHRRIHTGVMPYKCTACDKSFRYKVSQRTHKCLAQPPGEVVRQTGDLLQKLIQSSGFGQPIETGSSQIAINDPVNNSSPFHIEVETKFNHNQPPEEFQQQQQYSKVKFMSYGPQQLTNQSLDELVAEHCDKIGICGDMNDDASNIQQHTGTNGPDIGSQVPSPSEQFEHLCLYSPNPIEDVASYSSNVMETIDDSALKQFLFGSE